MSRFFLLAFFPLVTSALHAAPLERLWLTHAVNDSARLTVNWETDLPGPSLVEYGNDKTLGKEVRAAELTTLHHVEIQLDPESPRHYYRVRTGSEASALHSFKGYTGETIRVGLIADRGYAGDRDLSLLVKEDLHLLLTAGDNVASLHEPGREGTKAFSHLIDSQGDLFQSIPFLPILGNHDRELTPRGPKPPAEAVYDVEATAYRLFFPLPDEGWKWRFDLPAYGAQFLALDANHVSDAGTTWQTNHSVKKDSLQFRWYEEQVTQSKAPFLITLNNERNATMRAYERGAWKPLFQRSSAVVTGYGYFGERAEVDGLPYYNTCLKGNGDLYQDPESAFVTREDNYLLFTFKKDSPTLSVEMKNLSGETLDTRLIKRRF